MSISEQELLFWLLVLVMVGCFGGWLLKVAVDQMKADQRREEEAEDRRREYEQRYMSYQLKKSVKNEA